MHTDRWLERWLPLVVERGGAGPVLEIGCGSGCDTAVLAAAGLHVFAFDLDSASVTTARLRAPSAIIECQDVRSPFPDSVQGAGAIVASLSLHYFSWGETRELVRRIRNTLRPGGVFLCRLNSTEDFNFGATGHEVIEPNYYLVDGQPKRFFDAASIDQLFQDGWDRLSAQHMTTLKYVKRKSLWEVVVARSA